MNTIQNQIKQEIAAYEAKINTLKSALIILSGYSSDEPITSEQKVKRVTKGKKAKLGSIKWKNTLIPYLEKQTSPVTVTKIVKDLFPSIHNKTRYKINTRLSITLAGLRKKGIIISEGVRGNRAEAKMKYSIA